MSINDFMNKIKGQIGIDGNTALIIIILIFVGLCSFGLGRLSREGGSQNSNTTLDNKNAVSVKGEIGKSNQVESSTKNLVSNSQKEKMYVASKNGKLYYGANCSGANRIKLENQIWWSSEQEAMDAGYTKASSCK